MTAGEREQIPVSSVSGTPAKRTNVIGPATPRSAMSRNNSQIVSVLTTVVFATAANSLVNPVVPIHTVRTFCHGLRNPTTVA
jgi:hypothetical protein